MADIFIDKIIHNEKIRQEWFNRAKELIRVYGRENVLDLFFNAFEEVEGNHWINPPSKTFLGNSKKKIMEIADEYGLKPKGKKLRICPFHADKDPSLSLSNEKGVFNCFGCGVKGNIITFYAMLKKVGKNVNK
jgi:hypothetical protein